MVSTPRVQERIVNAGKCDQSKTGGIDGCKSELRRKLKFTKGVKVTIEIGIQRRGGYTKVGDRR
jgi:hypothetical protein